MSSPMVGITNSVRTHFQSPSEVFEFGNRRDNAAAFLVIVYRVGVGAERNLQALRELRTHICRTKEGLYLVPSIDTGITAIEDAIEKIEATGYFAGPESATFPTGKG